MAIFKSMFKKTGYIKIGSQPEEKGPSVPDGMWLKCSKCKKMVYREDVKEKFYTCPKCGDYFRIKAKTRLRLLLDKGSFQEWGTAIEEKNPIDFPEYEEKLSDTRRKTGLKEAVTIGKGSICGWETVIGVCDARFLMSSMGYVVGERITQAFEQATEEKLPVILFCCSGGARMQEGIISLMQMAKTAAAIRRHSDAGLLYIPVLTDPTTGGVTASFAMLGDVILAEPGALIGFAGPRVIRQTTGEKLPDGFQRAEFLLEKGMIDAIIERKNMREELGKLLRLHSQKAAETFASKASIFQTDPIEEKHSDKENKKEKSAWERVELSRSPARCTAGDYIDQIFDNSKLIAEQLSLTADQYTNTWQSESDIGIPWIKPDVLEYLREQKQHPEHYIFVPISFISEHIEVLFDNDVECYELCQELGVTYHRPAMPNTDSRLIDALVATVRANEHKEFKAFLPEEETFDELAPSATTKDIMKETDDLQMPEFVKKLIEKKGRENVKMPYLIKKMLEKAGKLPKE